MIHKKYIQFQFWCSYIVLLAPAMPVGLCIVYSCFQAAMAGLSGCDRLSGQGLTRWLSDPSLKKFLLDLLCTLLPDTFAQVTVFAIHLLLCIRVLYQWLFLIPLARTLCLILWTPRAVMANTVCFHLFLCPWLRFLITHGLFSGWPEFGIRIHLKPVLQAVTVKRSELSICWRSFAILL